MAKSSPQSARHKATAGTGVCKLTGKTGRFVRSHLLPQALTAPDRKGVPFLHFGDGNRPTRRWSSWYDEELVGVEGEEVLAKLDDWAIVTLRKHRLVWSGWASATSLPVKHGPPSANGFGSRMVLGIDGHKLQLFFLSLLWRAAATGRPEFADIILPAADLETLRQILIDGTPAPLEFYPTTLLQLSTRTRAHNTSPIAMEKRMPNLPGLGFRTYPFFRFYFDGLEAHIVRQASGNIDWLRPAIVGNSNSLVVMTVPYENSFQYANAAVAVQHVRQAYPRRPW